MTMQWNNLFSATSEGRISASAPVDVLWRAVEMIPGRVWELELTLSNNGALPVDVTRADPLSATVAFDRGHTLHFASRWGEEFAPVNDAPLPIELEIRSGRSSHGWHPWLGIASADEQRAIVVSPACSGNWHIDLSESGHLEAGIAPRGFYTTIDPGASFVAPSVFVAAGSSIAAAGAALADAVALIIPRNAASESVPVEWNHWWAYEDIEISEQVFFDNAVRASALGVDTVTLDAGWFGRADAASRWQAERGDWAQINSERFPSGLPSLAERVRATGVDFGIWLEVEAVGADTALRNELPDALALRRERTLPDEFINATESLDASDSSFLGYICLGSEAGRDYALRSLNDAVTSTGARWVKLDFNVDPGPGCTRDDHGHGPGDGLLRHYLGLYDVLDSFRAQHPDVVLEACSSGGLRIDLGLARHVHCFFLSDPDWTEHHLQLLWGASLMLPPAAILHFSWSPWTDEFPGQDLNLSETSDGEFDLMLRAAMLHRFGISLRLPELPARLHERLKEHIAVYRSIVAPLVRGGRLAPLNGQPLRRGGGERTPQFELRHDDRVILGAFRLEGGAMPDTLRWCSLDPCAMYRVTALADPTPARTLSGDALMTRGWVVPDGGTPSWLLMAERLDSAQP